MSRSAHLAPRLEVRISITPPFAMPAHRVSTNPPALVGLVERARRGDVAARAELYHRFAREVSNLALRLLRDRTEAADLSQDVFVEAFEQLSALRDPAKVGGWLRTITVRQAQRRFRRRKLRRVLGFVQVDELGLEQLARQDANQEAVLQLRRVDGALRKLDSRARIVWTLRFLEQETLPSIATLCDVSLATVKRDLSRAQAKVQAALEVS